MLSANLMILYSDVFSSDEEIPVVDEEVVEPKTSVDEYVLLCFDIVYHSSNVWLELPQSTTRSVDVR